MAAAAAVDGHCPWAHSEGEGFALLVDGRVDESILFIRDGNRALGYSADAEPRYTLMEAADEHPEDLPWESSPLDPDSDLLLRVCPSPDAAGARTILGREAVGYACTWKDPGEGMDQPEKIWLDKATRMLLEYGPMKATEFVVDPEIDVKTFSTKPPAGADVDVVKATGKAPPPPDHGEDERSPEDALATIEAGSAPNRIYYLGRGFNGWDLEDAEISPAGSETGDESDKSLDGDDTLYVAYGSTCGSSEDTCGAELELQIVRWNHPFAAVDKCRRQLPAVRGGAVPVETDYEVDIFTGDVAIRLEQITWEGLGKKVAAALREVGDKTAHEPLPEPTRGLAAGLSLRVIAAGLGRAPSTVSREVLGNGGRLRYRAAWLRAVRPKTTKLASRPALAELVATKLELDWSPQQIAGWLKLEFPDDGLMQVSHESIYRSLFVQTRGSLRKELTTHLRTKRATRRPAGARQSDGRGLRPNVLNISERPAEAVDRAVPGHWEGDLVFGRGMSPVATLVERSTRFLMLVALPEGHRADLVAAALASKITTLPAALTRTLTWDQGHEMAAHAKFTSTTGIEVYFCDPKSPWQRGSNENTNGLLRQIPTPTARLPHLDPGRLRRQLPTSSTDVLDRPSASRHHHKH